MTTLIGMGVITIALAVILYFARKDVRGAAQNEANKEAIKDVVKANRPVTDAERARVVQLFKRGS